MALAQLKQNDIIKKAVEIEDRLALKYPKMDKNLSFGGKIKYFEEATKKKPNKFLISALWTLAQTRNHIAHRNEFEITLKEYDLFIATFEYVSKYIK